MGKYDNWTRGENEALLNIIGGVDVARAILRGERKLTMDIVRPRPRPRPRLVGRVVKTVLVPAYQARNFAEAVKLGKFDNADSLGDLTRQFSPEQVGIAQSVKIELVEFDRNWWKDEAVTWGTENGKKPMAAAHTLGIAAGLPDEQRDRPIVELGSVQGGHVLYLYGGSDWRDLDRGTVEGYWCRYYLVGFLSE